MKFVFMTVLSLFTVTILSGTVMGFDFGWNEAPIGKITSIAVTNGTFEVKLEGGPSLCSDAINKDIATFKVGDVVNRISFQRPTIYGHF